MARRRPAADRKRQAADIRRTDVPTQGFEHFVSVDDRHQRGEQHTNIDRLGAKVLRTEKEARGRVGLGAEQRSLNVGVEARDAKLNDGGGISGRFDGRPWQRPVGTNDRSSPVPGQPGDRLRDPVKISCAVQLQNHCFIAMAVGLPFSKQRREATPGRPLLNPSRASTWPRLFLGKRCGITSTCSPQPNHDAFAVAGGESTNDTQRERHEALVNCSTHVQCTEH